VASTKRRRRTKHRGNAAGIVEVRGRTGRKPTEAERKDGKGPKGPRPHRLDKPPTWKSAIQRAAIATALFVVLVGLVFHQKPGPLISIAGFVFLMYIPLGYYTDMALYRRRQRQKDKPAS
jgi:hypothetical protein